MKSKSSGNITYIPDHETIRREARVAIFTRFFLYFWLLFGGSLGILTWRYPMQYNEKTKGVIVVSIILWIVCLVRNIREMQYINREEYEVRFDKPTTNAKTYERLAEGDTVCSVYVKKRKKPLLHYHVS